MLTKGTGIETSFGNRRIGGNGRGLGNRQARNVLRVEAAGVFFKPWIETKGGSCRGFSSPVLRC